MRSFLFAISLAGVLLSGALGCDGEPKCAPEGEARCGPCSMCMGFPLDELTEEEKASYDTAWAETPGWLMGTWSGSAEGQGEIPTLEIEAKVAEAANDPEGGARFFVTRETPAAAAGLCEGEMPGPCPRIEASATVELRISSASGLHETTASLVLDGHGDVLEAPSKLPYSAVRITEGELMLALRIAFAPDGGLWLYSEDGSYPAREIGGREAAGGAP